MPGIVVFRRRWSVGSDDLVVPGVFLFTMHLMWTIILGVLLGIIEFDRSIDCVSLLWNFVIGYLVILCVSLVNELFICIVSMRGSILNTKPRASMQYLLYIRLVLILIETGWLIAGVVWLVNFYPECPIEKGKQTVLGLIVCNWCVIVSIFITVWCTYDAAGRSWVKMKKYQRSMRESESKFQYKRSGSTRNWRQRKVLRAYQDSWQTRCRFLFCCMRPSDRNRNSFADIARLLSDFFRDLDVVPSDVVAGLVLLRKFQKIERKAIVEQRKNGTYEFLSGVPVTPRTQFLSLQHDGGGTDLELFQTVIHYAHFAVRAYGWPIYLMTQRMGLCHLCANLACCGGCIGGSGRGSGVEIVEDNCCTCNYAALQKLTELGNIEIIYATYHVDVGETPFFVALDYDRCKIVISIRGTLSMKDILTDLNAEGETLPLTHPREDWLGHKGMVQAAKYIYDKLRSENLLERAFDHAPERGTQRFQIVTVGHSLGAGTASILSILLREEYPDLTSFCYSPPGGLLSMPAVEYTKSFTISVVMGKDVVPRIGLHQMEALRGDLINAIKRSVDPKWKTITCSVFCCGCGSQPTSAVEMSTTDATVCEYMKSKSTARCHGGVHPADSTIALTSHQPLYPPGRIIHVVRHHPTRGEQKYEKRWRQALSSKEPVYQALWAQNTDFDEVLISPVMIQDHMPDTVLDALNKVITTLGPRKPQRSSSTTATPSWDDHPQQPTTTHQQQVYLETSFTSLMTPHNVPQSPCTTTRFHSSSAASSQTNGYFSTRSDPSPLPATILEYLSGRHQTSKSHSSSQLEVTLRTDLLESNGKMLKRTQSDATTNKKPVDLIYDDWLGLAPLASPESLSEVSSISSRTSGHAASELLVLLRTPKMMRRTPKINENLSTCADDVQNVKYFQKLRSQLIPKTWRSSASTNSSSSSSNISYASATSEKSKCCQLDTYEGPLGFLNNKNNASIQEEVVPGTVVGTASGESDDFQSAENILDSVMESAGCAEFFNSSASTTFLETHFDGEMFDTGDTLPKITSPCTDPDILSNFAVDLQLGRENRSQHYPAQEAAAKQGHESTTPKNVHFNPEVVTMDALSSTSCGTSPSKSSRKSDRWSLLPLRNRSGGGNKKSDAGVVVVVAAAQHQSVVTRGEMIVPKTILCSASKKRRNSIEDCCFARTTEALPLLSGLSGGNNSGGNGDKASPSFVRRKKYVYPIVGGASTGEGYYKGESNV